LLFSCLFPMAFNKFHFCLFVLRYLKLIYFFLKILSRIKEILCTSLWFWTFLSFWFFGEGLFCCCCWDTEPHIGSPGWSQLPNARIPGMHHQALLLNFSQGIFHILIFMCKYIIFTIFFCFLWNFIVYVKFCFLIFLE
jgi:hypothetical protein